MRILLLATLLLLVGLSGARAACPSLPDTAQSNFVENREQLALWLQQELKERTDRMAEQARLDAAIGNLEIQMERQRMIWQQQSSLPDWRWPPGPAVAP